MEHRIIINSRGKAVTNDRYFNSSFYANLAQAMIMPIRRSIDYSGIARKCFIVEQLPDGASLIYDKEGK